jgi:hypothetical protein
MLRRLLVSGLGRHDWGRRSQLRQRVVEGHAVWVLGHLLHEARHLYSLGRRCRRRRRLPRRLLSCLHLQLLLLCRGIRPLFGPHRAHSRLVQVHPVPRGEYLAAEVALDLCGVVHGEYVFAKTDFVERLAANIAQQVLLLVSRRSRGTPLVIRIVLRLDQDGDGDALGEERNRGGRRGGGRTRSSAVC